MTPVWRTLGDVLAEAQRLGWLGIDDIDAVLAHSERFVAALHGVTGTVLDLGTGPGIPGLVIAQQRPDLTVILLDRRAARIDFLTRAVRALGWEGRVTAVRGSAPAVAVSEQLAGRCDAVVARSFGDPDETLRCARPFLRLGGCLVVSEPPGSTGTRWIATSVQRGGFEGPILRDGLAMFHVEHPPT